MGRELLVLWAGRHRRDDWERICARYRKRIGRQVPLRELVIRPRSGGEGPERRRAEGEALLAALPDPCWSVALDRRGEMRSSEKLAAWLGRLRAEWPHPIAFLIGSDLGLPDFVHDQVRERLSFGPLTLPHELARVVLYEQLYRSLSMAAGIKYHRQSL